MNEQHFHVFPSVQGVIEARFEQPNWRDANKAAAGAERRICCQLRRAMRTDSVCLVRCALCANLLFCARPTEGKDEPLPINDDSSWS